VRDPGYFALTVALLEFLQISFDVLSFPARTPVWREPMLFSLQQRLFALALSILSRPRLEALALLLNRSSVGAQRLLFPQQISAQEAPASQFLTLQPP